MPTHCHSAWPRKIESCVQNGSFSIQEVPFGRQQIARRERVEAVEVDDPTGPVRRRR